MSGKIGNKSIIDSSLIAFFDVSNPNSYTNPSSTINDLSQNQLNGTLTNVTYDSGNKGSLVFGGNGYAGSTDPKNIGLRAVNNLSIEVFFNPSNVLFDQLLFTYIDNTAIQYGIGIYQNSPRVWGFGSRTNIGGSGAFNLNTWCGLTLTISNLTPFSNELKTYINGKFGGSIIPNPIFKTSTQTPISPYSFSIGGLSSLQYAFFGKIGSIKVYNRALSGYEVLQNFNASRNRFNL